jgi:hypothetical protein
MSNQCKNDKCVNEAVGRSAYCSDVCKTIYNRNKSVTVTAESVTIPAVTGPTVTAVTITNEITPFTREDQPITASLQHYEDNPTMYANRTAASTLNWSDPMTMAGLRDNGFTANRRPIPGDWDYEGCCELVEGKWQVCV